jgi:hypothetical protein
MDLKEFITTTLVEIQEGVHDAINLANERHLSGAINPVFAHKVGDRHIEKVNFDTAVTVATDTLKSSGGKLGAKLHVIEAGIGGKSDNSISNSEVSRIQFSIPIVPPTTTIKPDIPVLPTN